MISVLLSVWIHNQSCHINWPWHCNFFIPRKILHRVMSHQYGIWKTF